MTPLPQAAEALRFAADQCDKLAAWQAAAELLSWLSDFSHPLEAKTAYELVWKGAARNRWFDIAELLAGAAASRADAKPETRRLHAQMLMERGFHDEALARLEPLRNDRSLSEKERGEALGHLGRIHKERFVAAVTAADLPSARLALERALEAYAGGYREQRARTWLGINAVALLARAEAQEASAAAQEESRNLAAEILVEIPRQDPQLADFYSAAAAAEASLALGDHAKTIEWLRGYVAHPDVNAFALATTLRQFTRIWQLDRKPSPGPEIVELLRAALLDKSGGAVLVSANDVRRAREVAAGGKFEAVFGSDRFDSYENYLRGIDRLACVARIGRTAETGTGTGFVVPGNELSATLTAAFVLVTNAHVISEREADRKDGALHPNEAVVTFAAIEGVPASKEFGVSRVRFFSPPEMLDVTVAELTEPVAPKVPFPLAKVLPTRGSEAQVRVIGHPSGRGLSLSTNQFLDHEEPKVHYRTATEGGSSGGPVFSHDWKLLAVHHLGGDAMRKLNGDSGTYQANEGMWIQAIRKALT